MGRVVFRLVLALCGWPVENRRNKRTHVMRITKYGHACLLVEEGEAKILMDPGAFSKGFEDVMELGAILITHSHPDHLVLENIRAVLTKNPTAKVYADEDSAKELKSAGVTVKAVRQGDAFEVSNVPVAVYGQVHAVIHPDIPDISDAGYLIGERFFYPGDAYTVPERPVEILALPIGGPWLKVEEVIDYVRAVKPKVAIAVHDAVLSPEGLKVNVGALDMLGHLGELRVVDNGTATEV
jgi:L-ascorbate metabolism protein UlaG (beta-lactamase superfamily)